MKNKKSDQNEIFEFKTFIMVTFREKKKLLLKDMYKNGNAINMIEICF